MNPRSQYFRNSVACHWQTPSRPRLVTRPLTSGRSHLFDIAAGQPANLILFRPEPDCVVIESMTMAPVFAESWQADSSQI